MTSGHVFMSGVSSHYHECAWMLSHNHTVAASDPVLRQVMRKGTVVGGLDTIYQFFQANSTIVLISLFLSLPVLTWAITSHRFSRVYGWHARRHKESRAPGTAPYFLPFLAHIYQLALNPANFIAGLVKSHGYERPIGIKAGTLEFTMIANPSHIQKIFRSSRALSSKPTIIYSLRNMLGTHESVIPYYLADDSGMAASPRKGSTVLEVDRIDYHQARVAHKFLSGTHLQSMTTHFLATLERNLDELEIGDEWVELPDLYAFLQKHVTRTSVESLMGSKILEMNPTLVEDLWTFDYNVPNFVRRIPTWLMPTAYKARERLRDSMIKWHATAHANTDHSRIGPEDPDWEPWFGTKLIRGRQEYAMKMERMTPHAMGTEDMGLLFAANANALPSIFWFLFEAMRDSDLQARLIAEVRSCSTPRRTDADETSARFDMNKMNGQPLMQSCYAETLRLRVAIAMSRTSEYGDYNLDGYHIKQNQPLMIFSRSSAFNTEAWTRAGRPPVKPLDEFHAERFLVSVKEPATDEKDADTAVGAQEFSMENLGGLWLPYGGGQRMCPGRHFAKNEMLGTFALMFTQYELELRMDDTTVVQPDMRWYPIGALPPTRAAPFRIRRKCMA